MYVYCGLNKSHNNTNHNYTLITVLLVVQTLSFRYNT